MKTGVFFDVPMADYLAVDALSASGCEALISHGKWGFYMRNLHPDRERRETNALADGELLHTYLLEPERFAREYMRGPDGPEDKRLRAWKDAIAEAEATGRQILKPSQFAWLARCRAEVDAHPFARSAILGSSGLSEVTVYWEMGGVHCKARFDRLMPKIGIDLKKTRDASDDGFVREAERYRYDIKASWYLSASNAMLDLGDDRFQQTHFGFVAIEQGWPQLVNVFAYEREDLRRADRQIAQAIELYRDGLENGWGRDDLVVKRLRLPAWVRDREDDDND